ncbi:MAG TPA: type II secretion system F family protein [Steroidobacteraceae bacterium]|nr:type II secretion system F family protein [Steroidobacteraceae bacterium]
MSVLIDRLVSIAASEGIGSLIFIALAAGTVFALAMGISYFVLTAADPVRRRLGLLASANGEHGGSTSSLASRLRPLAKLIAPKQGVGGGRVERLLVQAGYRGPNAATVYFGMKAALIIALPLIVLLAAPLLPKVSTLYLIMYAVGAGYAGSLACSIWLDKAVARRQKALRIGFPDALDLLVVCVESGLGLAPAIQRVADELGVSHPELGEELALVNAEMRAGVERGEALKHLADRTGLTDVRGMTGMLVQTLRFGTSVADALRVYSEEFRDKRTQAAEEQAAKIGTKMIFPLVLCLFPSFFLVAIGPPVLGAIEAFSKTGP